MNYLLKIKVPVWILAWSFSIFADVSLTRSTTVWKSLEMNYTDEYQLQSTGGGVVDHVLDCLIIENEYLKVTLVPSFGGRIVSMIYKPTGHEQLYRTPVGIPYRGDSFYYGWLVVYGGIFPTFSEPEHGKYYLAPWTEEIIEESGDAVSVRMSRRDDVDAWFKPEKFNNGRTDLLCEFTVTLERGSAALRTDVKLTNDGAQDKVYEYWTCTTLAPGSPEGDPKINGETEIIVPVDRVKIPARWPVIRGQEQSLGGDMFTLTSLRLWKNWHDMGIAYANMEGKTFWGAMNHDNREGILRISDNEDTYGLKIWAWSHDVATGGNPGEQLPYWELWGGVSGEFFEDAVLGAGREKGWTAWYTPTVGMSAVSAANENAVVYLRTGKDDYSGENNENLEVEVDLFCTRPGETVIAVLTVEGNGSRQEIHRQSVMPDAAVGNTMAVEAPVSGLYNGADRVVLTVFNGNGFPLLQTRREGLHFSGGLDEPVGTGPAIMPLDLSGNTAEIFSLSGKAMSEQRPFSALPRGLYLQKRSGTRFEVRKVIRLEPWPHIGGSRTAGER